MVLHIIRKRFSVETKFKLRSWGMRGSQLWKEWEEECMKAHSRQKELDLLEGQLEGQFGGRGGDCYEKSLKRWLEALAVLGKSLA